MLRRTMTASQNFMAVFEIFEAGYGEIVHLTVSERVRLRLRGTVLRVR